MIEVKVECACGQRYKFDVEPVNGRMPFAVNCPVCGADGTDKANVLIQQRMTPMNLASLANLVPGDQPMALPTAVSPAAPAPASPFTPRLRLRSEPAAAAPLAKPAAASPPTPPRQVPTMSAMAASRVKESPSGGFLKGVVGALVASLVGMFGWYLLIKVTGYEIGFAAWGVGALTGLGARVVGAESSQKLGLVAGLFALLAIIGGEFLAVRSVADKEFEQFALTAYQEQLDNANAALALKTAEETRAFIARREAKEDKDVTAEELRQFQEQDLPRHRDFVAGKPSKAEFVSRMNVVKNSLPVQLLLLKESVGLFTLLWLFLGVGSAYKLGAGAND